MPTTPRMRWSYPAEHQDPWYDALQAFFESVDTATYALRENTNFVLSGGGNVTFNSGTGVVAWSAAIDLFSPHAGFNLSAAAGSVTVDDGQILYASVLRSPTDNTAITIQAALKLPMNDNALLLAVRRGNYVYWRNGALLQHGVTLSPLAAKAGGGGGGSITGASNIGGGEELFSADNGGTLEFRTVVGLNGIDAYVDGDEVAFDGAALYDEIVYDSGGVAAFNVYTDFAAALSEVEARARPTRVHMKTDASLTSGVHDVTYAEFYWPANFGRPTIFIDGTATLTGATIHLDNVNLYSLKTAGEVLTVQTGEYLLIYMSNWAVFGVQGTASVVNINGETARAFMKDGASFQGDTGIPVFSGTGYLEIFAESQANATGDVAPDSGVEVNLVLNRTDNNSTEEFVSAFANQVTPPKVSTPRGLRIAPAQLTANQDNYDPPYFSAASIVDLDLDAPRTITGFGNNSAYSDYTRSSFQPFKILNNDSAFALTIPHQSGSSDADKRVTTVSGASMTIQPGTFGLLLYSFATETWRLFADRGAGGGGGIPDVMIDATVTTNSSSATTIYTYTPTGPSQAVGFNIHVIGAETDTYGQFMVSAVFKTDITSVPTERDVTYMNGPYTEEGLDVVFSISGNDILIQVVGLFGVDVNWRVVGNVIETPIAGGGGGGA